MYVCMYVCVCMCVYVCVCDLLYIYSYYITGIIVSIYSINQCIR